MFINVPYERGGVALLSGHMLWFVIGGVVFVVTLAVSAVLYLLRRERDEADLSETEPAFPAPAPSAPIRPAPVTPPVPARPVTPPEPSIYTYPGLRGGWWICPNCACENEPEQTHCGVCLWDRSVEVG